MHYTFYIKLDALSEFSCPMLGSAEMTNADQDRGDARDGSRGGWAQSDGALLSVENLQVEFKTARGQFRVVDGVSWSVKRGETLALVGESGCGKSVSALSVMQLLPKPAASIVGGRIVFAGENILELSDGQLRQKRGRDMSMIFQDPMTSLNPVLTVGDQITEPLRNHLGMSVAQARARALELLAMVGIDDMDRRLDQYPYQFSGGMRQRVMIAIGLACHPSLIIADEPTTALDVTIQAQILEMMSELTRRLGITLVIITHNLGIVARYADRVAVMYAGKIVEQGAALDVFKKPRHPYTRGLLGSVPRLDRARGLQLETIEGYPPSLSEWKTGCSFAPRCALAQDKCRVEAPQLQAFGQHEASCHYSDHVRFAEPVSGQPVNSEKRPFSDILLDVKNINKLFGGTSKNLFSIKPSLHAVKDVSFTIGRGETLGLVGESGCGKTTVGRMILKLESTTSGDILFEGESLVSASSSRMRGLRRRIQVIFQDPYASLNPRMTMGETLMEPLVNSLGLSNKTAKDRVDELIDQVGLLRDVATRFPHQLSGGQRQRIGIARALAFEPDLIVCDEPVSALDVSIQGQIINLLSSLQKKLGVSYLFIAHDLAVVRHISHRVIVMYRGKIVETAECSRLYETPHHPYTRALLAAAPVPDPVIERARHGQVLQGEVGSVFSVRSGCLFANRCPLVTPQCQTVNPDLSEVDNAHFAACINIPAQANAGTARP
jgi:peptide/nickel transport system ATP-binding protein